MLVDSMGVVITNDGATILKEMDIEHPAAKMIIEVAKTKSNIVSMVRQPPSFSQESCSSVPEDLIEQNVHPVICEGFRTGL